MTYFPIAANTSDSQQSQPILGYEQFQQLYVNLLSGVDSYPSSQAQDLMAEIVNYITAANKPRVSQYAVLFVLLAGEIDDIDKVLDNLETAAFGKKEGASEPVCRLPLSIIFINVSAREIALCKNLAEGKGKRRIHAKIQCWNTEQF